tara:strand:- start:2920 stop:3834 length:915 start_codon:yes stop_codon:yes gene_type:complete
MGHRFTPKHIDQWREDGFVIIPDFFKSEEIAPVLKDYEMLYQDRAPAKKGARALNFKEEGAIGAVKGDQFQNIDSLPYAASPAINLISLHPELIAFAHGLLEVDQVHLYQCHTWAKFTGEADYDQEFHCDFYNHTLTVPGDLPQQRTVDFILYITDVHDDLGALHYVTKPDARQVIGEDTVYLKPELQMALKKKERSGAGFSGTLLAHSIDTFHRGTNLTRPEGRRYTMTAGYKRAGNDHIGFHVWQSRGAPGFDVFFEHATPEQLFCLGVPLPGDPFWTERTLRLSQVRWPDWDISEYRDSVK